jgi:hypothetical protein
MVAQYRQSAVCVFDSHVVSFHVLALLWSGQFPLLHPVTVQALALSCGADWDNPAGDTVGLLCFAAMGSKPYDLLSVCPLAQGA